MVKAASVCMGIRALLADLGVRVRIRLLTDASAGMAISARKGLGKVRHIETAELWVQSTVHDGTLEMVNIQKALLTQQTFSPST